MICCLHFDLTDEFAVREFDVCLIDHRIVHGCVNFNMPKEFLHLLHGHTFIYSHSRKCPTELVWMDTDNL